MNMEIISELIFNNWHLIITFFFIAVLYSSVGFGGGSSYLAILALTTISFSEIRATALLCNIIVVSSNVIYYIKDKEYIWSKTLPLLALSIPMAYLGGFLKINQTYFFILLGITLVFAAITMWLSKKIKDFNKPRKDFNVSKNLGFGGFIGFISGMVGIGGGIFLAPLLHLTKWDTPKKIAGTASLFILVNSIAGLLGQYSNPDFTINWKVTLILLITVFIGSQIGNRINNNYFTPIQLKRTTAVLVAFVGLRILWKCLFI